MKKLSNYTFYIVIFSLLLIIFSAQITKFIKKQKINNRISLRINRFPEKLLSKSLSHINAIRIIYIFSEFECEQCIISYLKALKSITVNENHSIVQLIISGNSDLIKANLSSYARMFKLNFLAKQINNEILLNEIPGIEIPAIIVIDHNNKIIGSWKADPVQLPFIIANIKDIL